MKKRFWTLALFLSVSAGLCYAEDLNGVFRNIRSGIDTFSDMNKLRGQILQTNTKQQEVQSPNTSVEIQQSTNNSSDIDSTPYDNIVQTDTTQAEEAVTQPKDVEVSFFGGLKPNSSLVEVINTFKKINSVTKLQIGYKQCGGAYMQFCTMKNIDKNFKNSPTDATSILNSIGNLLASTKRTSVTLANSTGTIAGEKLYLTASQIYIEGVPFNVEVIFIPSAGYYSNYPTKVLKGASGTAYPYLIETISMNTDRYDKNSQDLVAKNGQSIVDAYVNKYSLDLNNSCYEGDTCNDFVAVRKSQIDMSVTYKNYTYLEELATKYTDFKTQKSIQNTQNYNSINRI